MPRPKSLTCRTGHFIRTATRRPSAQTGERGQPLRVFNPAPTGGDGAMADGSAEADTFPKLLIRNAQVRGLRPAIRHKDLGIWQTWTWTQVLEEVTALSVGLDELGLKRGDKFAGIGANRQRLYWDMCAGQPLGAVPVPLYADSGADEIAFVLEHAEVKLAVHEDQEQG